MKLLAFDTSMAACSVAVFDADQVLAQHFVVMERGHAEALAPLVEHAMGEAGLAFSALDRIAVTTGPGTFTGVRIGLALARGFGVALNIPVIGIDTLSAIAVNHPGGPLLVANDARKDEVYSALFGADGEMLRPPMVSSVARALEDVPESAFVIGTAAELVMVQAHTMVRSSAGDLPVAANFARLAAKAAAPSAPPSPLYLRDADAKPQAGFALRASPITIGDAAGADILALIHGECFDKPWSASAITELLAMPGAQVLVAAEGAEPLAFVLARVAADEAEIITIATRPFAQRRGLARSLVSAMSSRLASTGTKSLFLEVAAGNGAAKALYASCQFTTVAARLTYYASGEDALVMRRELS